MWKSARIHSKDESNINRLRKTFLGERKMTHNVLINVHFQQITPHSEACYPYSPENIVSQPQILTHDVLFLSFL